MQVPGQTAHLLDSLHDKHATAECARTVGAALLQSVSSTVADHSAPGQAWCLSACCICRSDSISKDHSVMVLHLSEQKQLYIPTLAAWS